MKVMLKRLAPTVVAAIVMSLFLDSALLAAGMPGDGATPPEGGVALASTVPASSAFDMPLREGWWKPTSPAGPESTWAAARRISSQDQPSSGTKTWTKGGKIMTGIGLALIGVGAVFMASGNTDIGGGSYIDGKATGAVWISAGSVLTIIGLTRRH